MRHLLFAERNDVIPRFDGVSIGAFLFILLFGEKNEPRRTAARYRAFSLGRLRLARGLRNSLRSHSPRLFPALGCRPLGPIRAVFLFPLSLEVPSSFGGVLSFPTRWGIHKTPSFTSLDSRTVARMTERNARNDKTWLGDGIRPEMTACAWNASPRLCTCFSQSVQTAGRGWVQDKCEFYRPDFAFDRFID